MAGWEGVTPQIDLRRNDLYSGVRPIKLYHHRIRP